MKARHQRRRIISFITDSRAYPTRQCCARNRRARVRPRGQTRSYRVHTFSIRHNRGKPAHYVKSKHSRTPQLSRLTVSHIDTHSSAAWRIWGAKRFLLVVYIVRRAAHLYTPVITSHNQHINRQTLKINVFMVGRGKHKRKYQIIQAFDSSSTSHARKTWVQRCELDAHAVWGLR